MPDRIALGPVRLSSQGLAQVLEQGGDRIDLNARKGTRDGSAQAGIVLVATPSRSGTSLHADAKVSVAGRIAGLGRSLAGDVSRTTAKTSRALPIKRQGSPSRRWALARRAPSLCLPPLRARRHGPFTRLVRTLSSPQPEAR